MLSVLVALFFLFRVFLIIFAKYLNFNFSDIFASENFSNRDRAPPYLDIPLQLCRNFENCGKKALR